jgi:hypothetical protein
MQKDNTLRRLNRAQLLDMLYDVVKEKEELEQKLEETRQQLADKNIKIAESGSIAEAALKLNKVFEQAQAAADQYLYNMKELEQKRTNHGKETQEADSIHRQSGRGEQEEAAEEKRKDAGWKEIGLSVDEDGKTDRKKLVKKLMQGAKVTQSPAYKNIFWTDTGNAVFLKENGDEKPSAYQTIPLEEILYDYYRRYFCAEKTI